MPLINDLERSTQHTPDTFSTPVAPDVRVRFISSAWSPEKIRGFVAPAERKALDSRAFCCNHPGRTFLYFFTHNKKHLNDSCAASLTPTVVTRLLQRASFSNYACYSPHNRTAEPAKPAIIIQLLQLTAAATGNDVRTREFLSWMCSINHLRIYCPPPRTSLLRLGKLVHRERQ